MRNSDYNIISRRKRWGIINTIIAITSPINEDGNFMLKRAYTDAIMRAGAIPVILPPLKKSDAACALDFAHGVLFSGGGDISPRLYGVEDYDAALLYEPCPMRDEYELELAKVCFERDIPTLGICRGIQVMGTALGASLHFHIAEHTKTHMREDPHHGVHIQGETQLSRLIGEGEIYVNTCHHQAIADIGGALRVSAYAEDGTVEAIEAPGKRFFIGVQWHPERMRSYASDVLFAAFCAACK